MQNLYTWRIACFAGYYGSCILNLVNSLLTTIDEAVFKPMLQQMMSAPEGSAGVVLFFNSNIFLKYRIIQHYIIITFAC